MSCEVYGCRWSTHHTTKEHTCGQCHKKGHGMRGCPKLNYGVTLVKYTTMNSDIVKKFMSSDKFPPVSDPNYLKRLIFTKLNPGEYSIHSIGMGHDACIRNNKGNYEYFIIGDGTAATQDLYFTKNFIHGYKSKRIFYPKIDSLL